MGGSSKFDEGAYVNAWGGTSVGGVGVGGGDLNRVKKNTCEGVHLLVKLPPISLQACKFTKNEVIHTYF